MSKMSFQKVRHSLIYSLADDIIDEEEFVLLYNAYDSGNALYPYREYDGFELDSLGLDECLANFRVNKAVLPRLAAALRIPARFICHQGTVCSGLEGLCILLKRLAFSLQVLRCDPPLCSSRPRALYATQCCVRMGVRKPWPSPDILEPTFPFFSMSRTVCSSNTSNGITPAKLFWLC